MISDEKILELAHRRATKYTHRTTPGETAYGFTAQHLIDFICQDIVAAVLETQIEQEPDGWVKQIRNPGCGTSYDIVFGPIEGYAPFYIGHAAAGMMMVRKDRLRNVLALIDPPPIETDGKVMVFKNPNAADVLTRISAEVRAMIDTAEKEDTWRQG